MQPSLQDIEAFSIDSSVESESVILPPIIPAQCVKKIRTYQTKAENINVLQNADGDARRSSFETGDNVDNVLSGESLYKTFTFEQTSDEDVEKCIAFWKSVMQKNLEPIKCSIIESTKSKVGGEPVAKKSLDISEELNKTAKITEEKIHKYYRNLFTTTLKELQRKRLNEVKLIGKSRCKMCESSIEQDEDADIDQTEEISRLNNWESKSAEKSKSESEKPTLESDEKVTKTADCICEPVAPQDTVSVDTIISDRIRIIPETKRYKLINIIDKKKKTGAYSHWRKNVTEPCTCGVDTCTCNLNPAIVSWKPPDETCGCGQLQCQCKIEKQAGDQTKDEKVVEKTDVAELDKQCKCGNENCTCNLPELVKSNETMLELLASPAPAYDSSEKISIKSKETIIEPAEAERLQTEDLYKAGPIKKSSKADVTKCEDTNSSRSTLTSSTELPDKQCKCEEKSGKKCIICKSKIVEKNK